MNILLIIADQWRGECLSSLGHPLVKTPHLDALAADGVTFKRHYGQAAPCGPSRACLYTGTYLHNNRSVLNGTPLDARFTNVALEARKVGYKPALFGYTDVTADPRQYASGDYVLTNYEAVLPGMAPVVHMNSDRKPWFAYLKTKGYDIPSNPKDIFRPGPTRTGMEKKGTTFARSVFKAEDSPAAFLVDEAIKYLSVRQDKPWFVHMSFLAPHPPFVVPEPFNEMYDAEDMPLPVRRETLAEEAAQHPYLKYYLYNQRGFSWTRRAKSRENPSISELDLRQIRATYYGMMSEVDAQIGRLINALKEAGSYDDTLVIFTSDHGEFMGDHWMFSKYTHFDQAFYIPLIVRDPTDGANKKRGSIVEDFTESIDIMPTILDGIGIDIPGQCDGSSVLPFCRGEQPQDWRQEYHAEFDLRSPYEIEEDVPLGLDVKHCSATVIRGKRYKYVHFTTLPALFFDLEKDPHEFNNLINDPAYQELILEYAGKMLSWRMEYESPELTDLHVTRQGLISGVRSR